MKKYLAEFLGTCVLVVFGCGSAVGANTLLAGNGEATPLAISTLLIAFAFGLSIVAMAYSVGNVSGCHINPAVSLAMFISKKMTFRDFIGYILAQFLGGITGAGILCFFFKPETGLGSNGYGTASALGINMWQALVIEIILTFVFVFTILGVTSRPKENGAIPGMVIGLTLTLIHIMGIPFTGTSVNPARSLGPALIAGGDALSQVWVFIVAPLIGGAIAAVIYSAFEMEKTNKKGNYKK